MANRIAGGTKEGQSNLPSPPLPHTDGCGRRRILCAFLNDAMTTELCAPQHRQRSLEGLCHHSCSSCSVVLSFSPRAFMSFRNWSADASKPGTGEEPSVMMVLRRRPGRAPPGHLIGTPGRTPGFAAWRVEIASGLLNCVFLAFCKLFEVRWFLLLNCSWELLWIPSCSCRRNNEITEA